LQREPRQKIPGIMSRCADVTVATVRPDGAPRATVVSFVHDGLLLHFGRGSKSQKAANIAHEPRVSAAMTAPRDRWMSIEGLSMAATALPVSDASEAAEVARRMDRRFPHIPDIELDAAEDQMTVIRVRPKLISVLDYAKGFGHTDLVGVAADDIAGTLETMRHHRLIPTRTGA